MPMVHDAPSLIDEAPLEMGTTNPLLQQLSFVCVLLTDQLSLTSALPTCSL